MELWQLNAGKPRGLKWLEIVIHCVIRCRCTKHPGFQRTSIQLTETAPAPVNHTTEQLYLSALSWIMNENKENNTFRQRWELLRLTVTDFLLSHLGETTVLKWFVSNDESSLFKGWTQWVGCKWRLNHKQAASAFHQSAENQTNLNISWKDFIPVISFSV